ncbi:MAG: hypothetical protein KDC30_18700 [Saprospiraceae bacterium]|nr:hypothetical protein [Saprospiraceae bacterium]
MSDIGFYGLGAAMVFSAFFLIGTLSLFIAAVWLLAGRKKKEEPIVRQLPFYFVLANAINVAMAVILFVWTDAVSDLHLLQCLDTWSIPLCASLLLGTNGWAWYSHRKGRRSGA